MKKKKNEHLHATVSHDEGINYREIADIMTEIGFEMNHSSARNYILRIMRKFAYAITDAWDINIDEHGLEKIIKTPQFQQAICDVFQTIDSGQIRCQGK